jgi:hypothetical protein
LIESIKESYEPGFINAEAANRRRPWFSGFNPCVTEDTWVMSEFGPRQVKDLVGIQHGTYVNGELFSTTDRGFWKTGHKKVFKITTKEGYELRLTDNHKIKKVISQTSKSQYTDWVETKDLEPGDFIRLHNHRDISGWPGNGTFEEGKELADNIDYLHSINLEELEKRSYDFYVGFLTRLWRTSPDLRCDSFDVPTLEFAKSVQRMLARIGVISSIEKYGDTNTLHKIVVKDDNKKYLTGNNYYLSLDYPEERFVAEIESIVEDGYEDVYDCTVPGPSEFDANGIEAHNCVEIILANKGFCNLSTVFVPAFINDKNELQLYELEKAVRNSARHCLRITNVDISLKEWDKNQKRDRLLGVNLTGVEDAFDKCGISDDKRGYIFNLLKSAANDEASKYAKEMRVPTPLLVTTIQPGGTLSQLNASGPCSPGFHKSFAPFIKRTVRISSQDALAKTVLKQGYKVYPDPMSGISSAEFDAMTPENQKKCLSTVPTWVVVFGIDTGAKMKASDESAISQLERYKQYLQDYSDHNVSSTIQVADDEWDQVIDWIYDNWDSYIGVSFQNKSNDKYDLPPYEAVTEEEYHEIMKSCPPIDHDLLNKIENGHSSADDDLGSDCSGSACPIR